MNFFPLIVPATSVETVHGLPAISGALLWESPAYTRIWYPAGNSAPMLVCARLRHVAGTQWGTKKYMNMKHLEDALEDASIAG